MDPSQLMRRPPSSIPTPKDTITGQRPAEADEARSLPQALTQGESFPSNVENSHGKTRLRMKERHTGVVKQKKRAYRIRRANASRSKASIRRAELVASHGTDMVGANEGLKGETRARLDGYLDWKQPGSGNWLPAAPHDLFRQDFIDLDKTNASYLEPPACGIHSLDITSNCSVLGQNTWNFHPQNWRNITDSEGNKVMFLGKPPARRHESPRPEYWRHKGLIMLDPDDRPVWNWTDIPMVFSSKLEGGRMEALKRVFPWLRSSDFRARMPRLTQDRHGNLSPLHKYSTFGQRLSRFRDHTGCIPWNERAGSADKWRNNSQLLIEDTIVADDNATDGSESEPLSQGTGSMIESESTGQGNRSIAELRSPNGLPVSPHGEQEIFDTPMTDIAFQGLQYTSPPREDQAIWLCEQQMIDLQDTQYTPPPPDDQAIWPYEKEMIDPIVVPQCQYDEWFDPFLASDEQSGFLSYSQPLEVPTTDADLYQLEVPTTDAYSYQLDLRVAIPQTAADDQAINTALHFTRADFRSRYGFDAPITPSGESYYTQYKIIQAKHRELWVIDDGPPPLMLVPEWYGSFETCPMPQLTQMELHRLETVS